MDVIRLDPSQLQKAGGWMAVEAPELEYTSAERGLLQPSHPFLQFGTWTAFVAIRGGAPTARVVAGVDPRQAKGATQVGTIGFIAYRDDESLRFALAEAQHWLSRLGVQLVRCPVQLSTWFGHRAVTEMYPSDGGAGPFTLEPTDMKGLAETLASMGFSPAHRAASHCAASSVVVTGAERALLRMHAAGYHDRALDPSRLDSELGVLHRLASEAFADSWGYSQLSAEEFWALYRPMAENLDLSFVRIAEDSAGEAVGFVFAVAPAQWRAASGEDVVVKTVGVRPDVRRRCPGLGSALVAIVHGRAAARGFSSAIHAMMAEGSEAHRISQRWGPRIRSYATFERGLPC